MVDVKKNRAAAENRKKTSNGGPVFLPKRRASDLARDLLNQPWDGERVTPYDDQWFLGRPTV